MANSASRFIVTWLVLLHAGAWSQSLPDAGSVRQQIEQQRALPLPSAPVGRQAATMAEHKTRSGLSFSVANFEFKGNTLIASGVLAPVVSGYLNRPINFEDLQMAADAVAAKYRELGWIVRVYLPEQDISAGTVTLQVIEARFAGMRIEGKPSRMVRRSEIEAYVDAQQKSQRSLDAAAIDRALLLLDDLPGLSAAGTLAPGSDEGQTALIMETADEPFIYGDMGLDNTGARSTGSTRLSVTMNINSPGGRGELVGLTALKSQGSEYGRVAMTVPDGYSGLRLGINASSLSYKVIDGPGANSDAPIEGRSSSMGVDWSYPLVRSRNQNFYFSGGLENKSFYTHSTQVQSDYESNAVRIGISGNRFDDWAGGGANSGSVQLLKGQLGSMRVHSLLDSIDRRYSKVNYSFSRQQFLTTDHSLLISMTGQHATQVLDSSEKFYIGGAQTVRAYPASELGGERGQVLTGEWRWRLTSTIGLTGFMDVGRVVSLATASGEPNNSLYLRGHGVGLNWQGPQGLSARLTWAHRMGSNPKPTSTGHDGDGTLKLDRFWLTASMPF